MNLPKILSMGARRWHGLLLGALVVAIMHLTAATTAGLGNEPWPVLLPAESSSIDANVAALQRRASVALEKLVQGDAVEEPL